MSTEVPEREETLDYSETAAYLRQMAPTQRHAVRREFQRAADLLSGADLDRGIAILSWPVSSRGQLLGHVDLWIYPDNGPFDTLVNEVPVMSVRWKSFDPETGKVSDSERVVDGRKIKLVDLRVHRTFRHDGKIWSILAMDGHTGAVIAVDLHSEGKREEVIFDEDDEVEEVRA